MSQGVSAKWGGGRWKGVGRREVGRQCMRRRNESGGGGDGTLLFAQERPTVEHFGRKLYPTWSRGTFTCLVQEIGLCSENGMDVRRLQNSRRPQLLWFIQMCKLTYKFSFNQRKFEFVQASWSLPWNQIFSIGEMETVGVWLDLIWFLEIKMASDLTWLQIMWSKERGENLAFENCSTANPFGHKCVLLHFLILFERSKVC